MVGRRCGQGSARAPQILTRSFFRDEACEKAAAASDLPLDWTRLRVGSKVEKSAAGALEGFQASIEIGFLAVDLVDAPAQLAKLSNQPRVVIEQPQNGIGTLSTRCKQFGGFDGVCVDLENASHNPRYIKFGSERAIILAEIQRNVGDYAKRMP